MKKNIQLPRFFVSFLFVVLLDYVVLYSSFMVVYASF